MYKSTKEINENCIILALYRNGELVAPMPKKIRKEILSILNKNLKKEEFSIKEHVFNNNTAIFQRGNRKKRFSPEEVQAIKNEKLNIRDKAKKYETSTKTIMAIMHDRY